MAELLLKRKKGGDHPPAEVFEMPIVQSLVFLTTHATSPYLFDLRLFVTGITEEEIAKLEDHNQRRMKPWGARPELIQELLPHIREIYGTSPASSCKGVVDSLKWWWRLFDRCNDIASVRSVADLDNIHYATYRTNPCTRNLATKFFGLINYARQAQNLPDLHWTGIEKPGQSADLIAHEDVARLYTYFQQRCKTTLLRYEADQLALPTWMEMQDFMVLFLILTGWNLQVALDIDISLTNPDGSLACITQDVQNPLYSVITSTKNRSGGTTQEAHGLNKQRISCINTIKALYQQTAPLRARLLDEITFLEKRRDMIEKREVDVTKSEADKLIMKIADLKAKTRSPWLYAGYSGEVNWQTGKSLGQGHKSAIERAVEYINAHLPIGAEPVTRKISVSDLRDAFISFRWRNGGYSWLATMMAAGHSSLKSLNNYLNKRQHHQASQLCFLNVTNNTWRTIIDLPSRAVKLMPTVIAARTQGVSEAKLIRWIAGKDITIQGVGCKDYTHPPRRIAPNHKDGSGCRIQRCILCPTHAVLLPDSYIYIAKRLVELRYIQATMSVLAWVESDFPEETSNAESALLLYEQEAVIRELLHWEQKIKAGNHIPMRMEGAYE